MLPFPVLPFQTLDPQLADKSFTSEKVLFDARFWIMRLRLAPQCRRACLSCKRKSYCWRRNSRLLSPTNPHFLDRVVFDCAMNQERSRSQRLLTMTLSSTTVFSAWWSSIPSAPVSGYSDSGDIIVTATYNDRGSGGRVRSDVSLLRRESPEDVVGKFTVKRNKEGGVETVVVDYRTSNKASQWSE